MVIYKIYGLRAIGEDEIRYIGLTKKSLKSRLTEHLKEKRFNPYKINWIAKNKHKIEILLIEGNISSLESANEKEKYYINLYKLKGNRLTNLTDGGDGTQGFQSWNKGKNCSYIDKLIENSPRAKKIYCYNLDGVFISEYRSVKYASYKLGIARASIINIANFKYSYKQSKGFQFRWIKSNAIDKVFYDENKRINAIINTKSKNTKKIKIEFKNTVTIYNRAEDVAKALGLLTSSVKTYASVNKKTKYGDFSYA